MLLLAVALSYFGMFVMFYYLVHGQDKVVKIINKKHIEFLEQILKLEERVSAMQKRTMHTQAPHSKSSLNHTTTAPQQKKSYTEPKIINDHLEIFEENSGSGSIEDMFNLHEDVDFYDDPSHIETNKKNIDKGTMLEFLQL